MKRRAPALAVLGVVLGMTLAPAGLAATASAAADCDTVVVDDAHLFKGGGMSNVQTAADSLRKWAEVRVRTYTSDTYPNLDQFFPTLVAQCPSWQGASGDRKDNLVTVLVWVNAHPGAGKQNGNLGIYYGGAWEEPLADWRDSVAAKAMIPRFKASDYAGGTAAGLKRMTTLVDDYENQGSGSQGEPQQPSTPSEPVDLSGLWTVLKWAGIGLAVILVVLGGFYWYSQWSRGRAARSEARAKAIGARNGASELINKYDSTQKAVLRATIDQYGGYGADGQTLTAAQQTFIDKLAEASRLFKHASDSADVTSHKLAVGVYQELEQQYDDARSAAEAADAAADTINDVGGRLEAQVQSFPKDLAAAQAAIDSGAATIKAAADTGFKVDDCTAGLETARQSLATATKAGTTPAGFAALAKAQASTKEAVDTANGLTAKRQAALDLIAGLTSRLATAQQSLVAGTACFQRVSAAYAPSSWDSVKGNGARAQQIIADVEDHLPKLSTAADMQHQQWDDVMSSGNEADKALDKVDGLMKSVTELEKHLGEAKATAAGHLASSLAALDKTTAYIRTYDADIEDDIDSEVAKATKLLGRAEEELGQTMPDYLAALALITSADAEISETYREAFGEHEAAEQLRQQAASTLQLAQAGVSKAKEYIDDHDSDVDSSAEDKLRKAAEHLREAENANDPQDILDEASKAARQADDAYDQAKDDVHDAKAARDAAYASSYSSSSYSHHSGGGGGGGSIDWGGGGGGGGGSISFGGGGGGGGSVGW